MIEERIATVVASVTGLVSSVFSLWCTYIAFVGGTMPLLGLETRGSVGFGLLWLFIIDPLVLTVCYWISMTLVLAVLSPFVGARGLKDRANRRATDKAFFTDTNDTGDERKVDRDANQAVAVQEATLPTLAKQGRWALDPFSRHELRYWDGVRWTEHVSDRGVQRTDPPARWAPDPFSRHELRYWNGVSWTEHVSDGGVQATDPFSD